MTDSSAHTPRRKSLFWRLYLLAWLILAGGAVSYLTAVAVDPEQIAKLEEQYAGVSTQQKLVGEQQRAEIERNAVTGELQGLRQDVRVLRQNLARLETKVAEAARQQPDPTVAVAPQPSAPPVAQQPQQVLSERPADTGTERQTAVPAPQVQQTAATTVAEQRPRAINRNAPPLPVRGPARRQTVAKLAPSDSGNPPIILNSGINSSPIATGSVAPATREQTAAATGNTAAPPQPTAEQAPARISFGAAQVTQSINVPRSSAVAVSDAPSLEGLRASWHQLASQHPALLGTLEPRYYAMGVNGPYRLLAGPLSDRSEADRLCSALRAYGVRCGVGDYVGNALLAN